MFWTLRRMHIEGKMPVEGLVKAVAKNWITEAQKDEIIQAKEDEDAADETEDEL